jgi:signal transduction histidine kinase
VSSKLLLMHGDDGVDRVLESNRDITERRAAEAKLEQLIEALREADRRKVEFMAMLSHELRNPLSPIRNSCSSSSVLPWAASRPSGPRRSPHGRSSSSPALSMICST